MFEKSANACSALTLAAVAIVQFMVSLDLSVVNVGLPRIAEGLDFGAASLTWVIHAYALTFGGLLLLGGKAADRYGHRRILLLGLGLFALASLAGGFAQDAGQLVAARAAQGIGAAALAPAALALLTTTFPAGRARVRAFGVWGAMTAAGGALGVLIGGLLTEYVGWQWVMFVSVPMAGCAFFLAYLGVAVDPPRTRGARPDVLGAVLATAGMTLLVFGIVRTEQYSWASPVTVVTLVIAVALLVAFVHVERSTVAEPLIRLGLFANRSVVGANVYNLLVGAAMASAFYFVSLYLQRVLGHGPALTGAEFLPFALGVVAGSVLAIKLGYRLAPRTLLVLGGALAAVGFAWFGSITSNGAFLTHVLGPSIVASVGFGLCLGPVVSTATVGVASRETGTASGLLNSSRQLGASLGLAVLGTAALHRTGADATPEALGDGYAFGLSLSAVLLVVAAGIAAVVLPRTPPIPGAEQVDDPDPLTTTRPRPSGIDGRTSNPITHGKGRDPMAAIQRSALRASYTGLGLTLVAALLPHVDRATTHVLVDHIRTSYPTYDGQQVDATVNAWLTLLSVVGVLGVLGWIWTMWTVKTGKRWARWSATAVFVIAACVALTALLTKDVSGDVGLAPPLGLVGVLPCLAGLWVVVALWKGAQKPAPRPRIS